MLRLLKETISEFSSDECPTMAASIAYFTVFSLPALLVIITWAVGFFFDPEDIHGTIGDWIRKTAGPRAADQVQGVIAHADRPGTGIIGSLIGLAGLLFGATGVISQIQNAMNKAWDVETDSESGVKAYVKGKLRALLATLVTALFVLASLVSGAFLSAAGEALEGILPPGYSQGVLMMLNMGASFLLLTFLFACIFKYFPAVKMRWSQVLIGGIFTAILFQLGQFGLALYLGTQSVGSAYGAAGSLVLILLWIYYSSLIFLLGAEFTQVWIRRRGESVLPIRGARRKGLKPAMA